MSVAPLIDAQPDGADTSDMHDRTLRPDLAILDDPALVDAAEVVPAPRREPPFDDEVVRRLSLVGPQDQPLPFAAYAPSRLRLRQHVDRFEPQPTSRTDLPDPEGFLRRFVIAVIETVTGRRAASQLAGYASAGVHAGLTRDVGKIDRLGTLRRPATVHSIRFAEPADGVVEAAVVVAVGRRYRAIAVRLEGLDGRWRCVRLQIG